MRTAGQPAAKTRNCYCDSLSDDFRREHGIQPGFCGTCERCGKPGHTQHFPGPLPYTGSWCDRCVRIVAWTWPLRDVRVWFVGVVALAWLLVRLLG